MRSAPMSAILVKMPPQMRRAEAPRDSPMAKPMKHRAGEFAREKREDADHEEQLAGDEQQAHAHAGAQRDAERAQGVSVKGGECRAGGDESPESDEKFPLLGEVGFARFPNDLGDGGHRRVHGQAFGLYVLPEAERAAEGAHDESCHQHDRASDIAAEELERDGVEVGDLDIRFAGLSCRNKNGGLCCDGCHPEGSG